MAWAQQAVEIGVGWSTFVSFVAIGFTFYQTVMRRDERRDEFTQRLAALEVRQETLWHLIFPGSVAAALRGGILERNSPLTWSLEALAKLGPLTDRVKTWYDQGGNRYKDLELLIQLSNLFGADVTAALVAEPEPKGYGYEAVVLALFYLCRPESELFRPFNTTAWQEKI